LLVVELVYRCIVSGFDAHQQLWRNGHGAGTFQNFAQHARRNLAATAAAVGQAGEAGNGSGGCGAHDSAFVVSP